MPTSGLNYDELSDDEKREINNLPAMIYHGENSEESVKPENSSLNGADYQKIWKQLSGNTS